MAYYIKVNPKVAQYLEVENVRSRLADGNYLLWQADILPFGRLAELADILARIGAIALQPYEARQEQQGEVLRELPQADDFMFRSSASYASEDDANYTSEDELSNETND